MNPETVGPYRIVETIARGGMGVVYRASHVETGQVVALKTVVGPRPGTIGSLRREILALLRVRHPGVVRLVGEGVQDGVPWHAMELLDGKPLRDHLESLWQPLRHADQFATTHAHANAWAVTTQVTHAALESRPKLAAAPAVVRPPAGGGDVRRSLSIARRLCQTLAFLHGEGIVHGDLKPDNIVLQGDDKPVLVDFGVMRRFAGAGGREALELENEGAGTLAYMAPEQMRTTEIDARADLYAVGCILYEMVCGRPPFLDDDHGTIAEQARDREPPPPSELVNGVDPRLESLILRLLAKQPHERPGYADDVGVELENLGADALADFATPPPRAYLYRPSFAGRRDLLALVDDEVAGAFAGRGRCVVLSGPSGAGKTRLGVELARRARSEGMRVLSGECVPMSGADRGAGLPLSAFRPLLQEIADRCRVDGPKMTERLLGAHLHVLLEIEPALARVPGHEQYAAPPRLPAERSSERVQHAVVEVLERFAAVRPLFIVLDDLQWADDLTIGVLRELVNRPRGLHAVVLVTCRAESSDATLAPLRGAPAMLELSLEPLGAAEVERIIAGMTARQDPPARFVQHLAVESGGNPFFVAEYLKAAVTEGLLARERGRWQFRADDSRPSSLAMPGSVQALVARRLDGLGEDARMLVAAGAVLGRSWSPDTLAAVVERDAAAIDAPLDELIARQIVVDGEAGELRFAHDKIREIGYAAIEAGERRRWHARAAAVLVRGADDPSVWRRLAHHYQLAGDNGSAFEWADRAGRHAHAAGAYREAREHFEVACALAPTLPPRAPVDRARLHRLYAEALHCVGEIDAGGRELLEALASLGRPLPQKRRGWIFLLAAQAMRQLWMRLAPGAHLAKPDERERLEEAALASGRLVAYYFFRNRAAELLASVTLATNLAEAAGADGPFARASVFLAGMVGVMGLERASRGYFTRARQAALRSGDIVAELYHAQIEAMYHLHRADWPTMRAIVEPGLERSRAAGAAFETEALLMPAALMALFTGDAASAEAHAQQLLQSARALGHKLHENWARIILGEAALRAGRPEETLALVEPAAVELEREGDIVNRLNCLGLIAGARLALGDRGGALVTADAALQQVDAHPSAALASYQLHEHVPAVYLDAWERARADGVVADELAARARRACAEAGRYARVGEIARPLALRHQARRQALLGRARRARKLAEKSVTIARANGMPHDEARATETLTRL